MFQPFQTLQVQLHKPTFCIIHSQNFTLFSILFYAFPLFQFQIYNYNCTIPILQLQTTFYNCTNCHQLHVKICPGAINADEKHSSSSSLPFPLSSPLWTPRQIKIIKLIVITMIITMKLEMMAMTTTTIIEELFVKPDKSTFCNFRDISTCV